MQLNFYFGHDTTTLFDDKEISSIPSSEIWNTFFSLVVKYHIFFLIESLLAIGCIMFPITISYFSLSNSFGLIITVVLLFISILISSHPPLFQL